MIENLLVILEPYIRTVAMIIIHSLWQGAIIGIAAAIVLTLFKNGSPVIRYAISFVAMVSVITAASITALYFDSTVENSPNQSASMTVAPGNAENHREIGTVSEVSLQENRDSQSGSWRLYPSINGYIFAIWIVGVMLISIYHLLGWGRARQFARKGTSEVPVEWQKRFGLLCRELRINRVISFFGSSLVKVPCVIGWVKPVVLVPVSMFTSLKPAEIEMILVHELAHIRRYDVLINFIQTTMETLFFFNPAIWWLSRQIRIERENCCDDMAILKSGDRLKYARALANLEESRLFRPAFDSALNGTPLERRIQRIVGIGRPRFYSSILGASGITAIALFMVILFGSIESQTHSAVPSESSSKTDAKVISPDTGEFSGRWKIESNSGYSKIYLSRGGDKESSFSIDPDEIIEKVIDGRKTYRIGRDPGTIVLDGVLNRDGNKVRGKGEWHFQPNPEYVEFMGVYGLPSDDTEKILTLAIFDVSRKFISELEDLGYSGLDVDELISARIFNVNSDIINQFREAGYTNLPFDKLISIRVQNVSPDDAREFEKLGFKNLSIDDLVSARIFGVTPKFARSIRDNGNPDITFDKLISMRVQGVDLNDGRLFDKLGFKNLSVDDLISAKIFGVTPELVEAIRNVGYPDITFDKLIAMRVHKIDPEYKSEFEKLGFKNLSIDNLISARIFKLTPDFVEDLHDAGYRDLSFDSYIALKVFNMDVEDLKDCKRHFSMNLSDDNLVKVCCHNISQRDIEEMQEMGFTDIDGIIDMLAEEITPRYIDGMSDLGYSNLTPEQLVRLHRHDVTLSFVRRMQRDGVKNLTVDELVERRKSRNKN